MTHRARDGRLRADTWYRGQVARSIAPLLARRLQTSLPGHAPMPMTEPSRERLPALAYFLRHAFRRLTREPAFTIAAALTLAIGVGGNVAVFAVVEAVLLRPLPYPAADRLLILNHRDTRTGITKEFVPTADYADIAARNVSFDAIGVYSNFAATIYGDDEPIVRERSSRTTVR